MVKEAASRQPQGAGARHPFSQHPPASARRRSCPARPAPGPAPPGRPAGGPPPPPWPPARRPARPACGCGRVGWGERFEGRWGRWAVEGLAPLRAEQPRVSASGAHLMAPSHVSSSSLERSPPAMTAALCCSIIASSLAAACKGGPARGASEEARARPGLRPRGSTQLKHAPSTKHPCGQSRSQAQASTHLCGRGALLARYLGLAGQKGGLCRHAGLRRAAHCGVVGRCAVAVLSHPVLLLRLRQLGLRQLDVVQLGALRVSGGQAGGQRVVGAGADTGGVPGSTTHCRAGRAPSPSPSPTPAKTAQRRPAASPSAAG